MNLKSQDDISIYLQCPFKDSCLTEKLQISMDSGAKAVLIPSENKIDFADIPSYILDKLEISFYSDPINAGFKAMELD